MEGAESYEAPSVTEHGSVESITKQKWGWGDDQWNCKENGFGGS